MWTFVSPPQEKSSQDSREKKKKRERKKLPTKQEISSDPSSIISPSKPCEKFSSSPLISSLQVQELPD